MVFNGLLADAQFSGNLLVQVSLSDVVEDFRLPGGEWRNEGFGLTL